MSRIVAVTLCLAVTECCLSSDAPGGFTNSIGMKFNLIPAGEFTMGSSEPIQSQKEKFHVLPTVLESERPGHRVRITKPIYVGETEVTQEQFEKVMGWNPSANSATGYFAWIHQEAMELYRRLPAPGEVATITAEMHDTMFHEEGVPPFEVPPKFFEDVLRFFSDAAPDAFPNLLWSETGSLKIRRKDGQFLRVCWYTYRGQSALRFSVRGFRFTRRAKLDGHSDDATQLDYLLRKAYFEKTGNKVDHAIPRKRENQARDKPTIAKVATDNDVDAETKATARFFREVVPQHLKGLDTSDFPVDRVTWEQAQEFCRRLSAKENREYRLPTEAEWEYTCRAGADTDYSFGNARDKLGIYGWYRANSSGSLPRSVGLKPPNAWGLYDMHGNVSEWCSDKYSDGYYHVSPEVDPKGPEKGVGRVARGGNYLSEPGECRSRSRDHSTDCEFNIGFRVVLVPEESK